MRTATALVLTLTFVLGGCGPKPISAADLQRYTGLRLCESASVRDLTTPQERDTTPGFSFHVQVNLQPACDANFLQQLAALSGGQCAAVSSVRSCFVEDASRGGATGKHTSLAVTSQGGGRYDLRFYE